MPLALGEAHDLVLDRGAIARPDPGDVAGIERRAVEIGADQLMRRRWSSSVMWQAICGVAIRSVRNENGGGGSSPGWRSSPAQSIVRPSSRGGVPVFSRPSAKPRARQGPRQAERRRLADPAGRDLLLADMDEAAEKGAGGQHHPARRAICRPSPSTTPAHPPVRVEQQILGGALDDRRARRSRPAIRPTARR